MKRIDKFWREGFKETRRNFKLSFSEADRALGLSAHWKWANFRDGNVALAQKDGFSARKLSEITGKMRLCLMNVQSNHGLYVA